MPESHRGLFAASFVADNLKDFDMNQLIRQAGVIWSDCPLLKIL